MAKHGGKRTGAGRKTKTEEEKTKSLALSAIVSEFGSELEVFQHVALQAKISEKEAFKYLQMLFHYAYGKPKESTDVNLSGDSFKLIIQPTKDGNGK